MSEPYILTVTDIRQWGYCRRVVYYTYCIPLRRPTTYKMAEGQLQHEETAELEHRRSLRVYGLTEGERHFSVRLYSERLGLSGMIDMIIVTPEEPIPVEYKHSRPPLALNHRAQLAAYALLVEELYSKPVRRAFVYWIPQKRAESFTITSEMRRQVRHVQEAIWDMLAHERIPPAARNPRRCHECEFRRFCNDVE